MGSILEKITEAIKEMLIGMIESNLTNMFTDVNEKVGTIAGEVGRTPSTWNGSIYSMIRGLSESVIVPIAGIIITFVLCYELISMITEKNNIELFARQSPEGWDVWGNEVESDVTLGKEVSGNGIRTGPEGP